MRFSHSSASFAASSFVSTRGVVLDEEGIFRLVNAENDRGRIQISRSQLQLVTKHIT